MKDILFWCFIVMTTLNTILFVSRISKEEVQPISIPAPAQNQYTEIQLDPEPIEVEPIEVIPKFETVPKYRQMEDSILGDIISHSKAGGFNGSGRMTNAHETTHQINSEMRNYHYSSGKKINALYVLDGHVAIIDEPNMRKSRVKEFVPKNCRSYRYSLYISGSPDWEYQPLYIFDEWVAYVNGGICGIDDFENGRYRDGGTDGVSGCLGFSIYAVALAMAVEKYDPEYWKSNEQFKTFLIWHLKRAEETFKAGRKISHFNSEKQEVLLKNFLKSNESAGMRAFIKEHLNGVWLDFEI